MRSLNLGIIAGEFFDLSLGGRGGFGKIGQTVAAFLQSQPNPGVKPIFLHGFREGPSDQCRTMTGRTTVLLRPKSGRSKLADRLAYRSLLKAEGFDVLLTIDYVPSYRVPLLLLPWTPTILWIRDPRTPEDRAKIGTLKIPGDDAQHAGIGSSDSRSLGSLTRFFRWIHRPYLLAVPAPFIAEKIPEVYGISSPIVHHLPSFLDFEPPPVRKAERPRAIFLGRLDPIKRPWLFFELARQLPQVEFVCLGQSRHEGHGGWRPQAVPSNLRMCGHLDGAEKIHLLASSWVLINTSIHETLPMSFLEALACETPIVSCQDAGGLASQFGVYVGRWDGTGIDALPSYIDAITQICDDVTLRTRLGSEGAAFVAEHYTPKKFWNGLCALLNRLGINIRTD